MIRSGGALGATFAVCAGGAALAIPAAALLGAPALGLALAIGLLLGSVNGFMARRALAAELDFRLTSLGRLLVLSVAGLGLGFLLGMAAAPWVLVGIGLSQLALAAVAAAWAVRAMRGTRA